MVTHRDVAVVVVATGTHVGLLPCCRSSSGSVTCMNVPRSGAATVRGALVGACSGAVVVAAHGVGGGDLPSGDALVLLAGAGALVGTCVRTVPTAPAARLALLTVVLGIGQAAGHLALAVGAGHVHDAGLTSAMFAAHAVAAVICAVLIAAAERGHGRAVVYPASWPHCAR